MKFLFQAHPQKESRCVEYLSEWARDSKLIICKFFFRNSGHQIQMTQEGLFRTLLFQMLQQASDLIWDVTPRKWEALQLFTDCPLEWSLEELQQAVIAAAQLAVQEYKVCFFADGLDEFNGNHKALIDFFLELMNLPGLKLCVSSRPWVVFEDAFGQAPSLELQDLTYLDIKLYVSSHLSNDSGFSLLRRREPEYANDLVENIVEKSAGVFLWVRFAVQSILAGMDYGDRVSDLQKRLDALPEELEGLYGKILLSIEPFYLEHAAQLFRLVDASNCPPDLLLLAFADEDESWLSVIGKPFKPITVEEENLLLETMRRRINSRSKGFLKAERPRDQNIQTLINSLGKPNPRLCGHAQPYTVQYLHRTVKDYISKPDVQQKLVGSMKSSYDPHLGLCAGILACFKSKSLETKHLDRDNIFWNHISIFMYHASKMLPDSRRHLVSLMDELDKTCKTIAMRTATEANIDWTGAENQLKLLEFGHWMPFFPPNKTDSKIQIGGHLLCLATRWISGKTLWQRTILSSVLGIRENFWSDECRHWFAICKMMIEHGAGNYGASVGRLEKELTKLLQRSDGEYAVSELRLVEKMLMDEAKSGPGLNEKTPVMEGLLKWLISQ